MEPQPPDRLAAAHKNEKTRLRNFVRIKPFLGAVRGLAGQGHLPIGSAFAQGPSERLVQAFRPRSWSGSCGAGRGCGGRRRRQARRVHRAATCARPGGMRLRATGRIARSSAWISFARVQQVLRCRARPVTGPERSAPRWAAWVVRHRISGIGALCGQGMSRNSGNGCCRPCQAICRRPRRVKTSMQGSISAVSQYSSV